MSELPPIIKGPGYPIDPIQEIARFQYEADWLEELRKGFDLEGVETFEQAKREANLQLLATMAYHFCNQEISAIYGWDNPDRPDPITPEKAREWAERYYDARQRGETLPWPHLEITSTSSASTCLIRRPIPDPTHASVASSAITARITIPTDS